MDELLYRVSEYLKSLIDAVVAWAKPIFYSLITAIATQIAPIKAVLFVVFASALLNICMGIKADKVINKKDFSICKFWDAIIQLGYLAIIIYIVNLTAWDDESIRSTCIHWFSYIIVWGYITNSLKNAKKIWPNQKHIALLYEIMTIDILYRIKENFGMSTKDTKKEQENSRTE